ncbi:MULTISPECIES: hypothetical protein [Streptomyces]|nr:hypothetical protein [Streptomyces sp. ADI97-07]RPK77971.1 hypothetical protein EES45_19235 [Streptomyces sp. ADI97-07]
MPVSVNVAVVHYSSTGTIAEAMAKDAEKAGERVVKFARAVKAGLAAEN